MLNEKLIKSLNEQLNMELGAGHNYLAMAAYLEYRSYEGFANFFMEQAKEEFSHGMRIYNYLNDRGVKAVYSSLPTPPSDFDSVLDVFKKALAHEKVVTKSIHNLADIAYEVKDHATISFLNWFIDEQVEEEATFDTHIEYITRIKDDENALFTYEQELGKRKFSAE